MKLTIDGREVEARGGETLLDCALRHNIEIPHLCSSDGLRPHGGCRMCLVEVEGVRGYPPSCATPAAEGMRVLTQTPALRKLRKNVLGLMMLEHPNACLVCGKRELCEEFRPTPEKAGRTTGCHTCNNKPGCDVRELAADLGLTELPVPPVYHQRPLERDAPFLDRDLNLCILCGRCVRVCREHQGRAVIDFVGRGSQARVGQAFDQSLAEAGCSFCGSCVDVCPTGTLSDRHAKWFGAPDRRTPTTCMFCGEACALIVAASGGQAASTRSAVPAMPLCVLGRFAVAEFMNSGRRLGVPMVRVGAVQRQTEWKQALEQACARLARFQGAEFALVCRADACTLEDRRAFERFTREIMGSPHYIEIPADAEGPGSVPVPEGVRAVFSAGPFIDPAAAEALELLLVSDCLPSPLSEKADFVFPAAVFTETEGTIRDVRGEFRKLYPASEAPGAAWPEWRIVTELSRALGAEGLPHTRCADITAELGVGNATLFLNRNTAPPAALHPEKRRTWFRGHRIEAEVSGLLELPQAEDCPMAAPKEEHDAVVAAYETPSADATPATGRFRIVESREIVPNTREIIVEAPEVARKAVAGQFAIVMADAYSERVPYTLSDWDAERGTITLVILEKGQSSRKIALMEPGDCLAHVTGPLGIPLEIKNYGTVYLTGGCYGVGAIVPAARALRAAGNRVVAVAEARSHYLAYYREKLAGIADEFVQTTVDGSSGEKGHAVDVVEARLKAGGTIDLVIAIGCPFMMMLTARATEPFGVRTLAALNPIMVDGTGMCGACRITVGGGTKFACVDGPFFDAHQVDWNEVRDRRTAYAASEIQSVGRSAPVRAHTHAHGNCSCKSDPLNV